MRLTDVAAHFGEVAVPKPAARELENLTRLGPTREVLQRAFDGLSGGRTDLRRDVAKLDPRDVAPRRRTPDVVSPAEVREPLV